MLVWKTNSILSFTGQIDFAEKYLGSSGGSRLFIKLVGIVIIFAAWLYMFNLGTWLLYALFLPGKPAPTN